MTGPSIKPAPPPKQTRPHVRDNPHTCQVKAPCGGECILRRDIRHRFHTCNNEHCERCHGRARWEGGVSK